jgi:glycosyltransferase involved in cell wall biosynthesis
MKLHILIPTYNRALCLQRTLQAIKPLLSTQYVSVFDNASTDDTQTICEQFAGQYTEFSYHRRPVNIGLNGNVLTAVVSGVDKGDLLWILADDDEIDSLGLKELIEYLKKTDMADAPDALVVGACSSRNDSIQWPPEKGFCFINKSSSFWLHASFLPTLILKISTLRVSIKPDLFYVGGCYSQVLLLRHLLNAESTVSVISRRVVYRGEGEQTHSHPVWWLLSWHRAIKCFPKAHRLLLYSALSGPFWRLPLRLIKQTKLRSINVSPIFDADYFDTVSCYDGIRKLYMLAFIPLLILPRPFYVLLQSFKDKDNHIQSERSDSRE